MSRGRDWTLGEIRKLMELAQMKCPMSRIAERLGRTSEAVRTKLKYLRRENEESKI